MRRRSWVRRAWLAAAVAAVAAASCTPEDDGRDEDACYRRSSDDGTLEVAATQTLPDGTAFAVAAEPGPADYQQVRAYKIDRYNYLFVWFDNDVEYELTVATTSEDGQPFELQGAELCAYWLSDKAEAPPCASAQGEAECKGGCAPAVGFGQIIVESHCSGETWEEECQEETSGEVTIVAETIGQLHGTVAFEMTSRLERRNCSRSNLFGGNCNGSW